MKTDFEKCTRYKNHGDVHHYECRLFLWHTASSNKKEAERKAFHYWQQYASDGEYSSIIGGESVIDKLTRKGTEE